MEHKKKNDKRKGKSDRYLRKMGRNGMSEDESDNASVITASTEQFSGDCDEFEDATAQEIFEDKMSDALELLSQKSAKGRTDCLNTLKQGLIKKYVPDYVDSRKMTLCDAIEKSLKKGKDEEQGAAADLAQLLCVQLGLEGSGEVIDQLKPLLLNVACNNSVGPKARAKCYAAVGLMTFLEEEEGSPVIKELLHQFEIVFAGSYLKGDGSIPNVSVEDAKLHAAAISAWSLLATLLLPFDVYNSMNSNNTNGHHMPSIEKLSGLLSSPHVEIRLAAGEALAIIFELGRANDGDFGQFIIDDLADVLAQLTKGAQKFMSKKDRKMQKAPFREILNFIESNEPLEDSVKFKTERLEINSWAVHKEYDTFCSLLGPGINTHLAENELIRDILHLGPCLLIDDVYQNDLSTIKKEQKYMNVITDRYRTKDMRHKRDKRMVI